MHVLKNLFSIIMCCLFIFYGATAQTGRDTPVQSLPKPKVPVRSDSLASVTIQAPDTAGVNKPMPVLSTQRVADSLKKISDSVKIMSESIARQDSITRIISNNQIVQKISSVQSVLKLSRTYNFYGKPKYRPLTERDQADKDVLFYFLCGLVLYFAILKLAFGKYLSNLFTLFFRVTMRQNQIREQLLQTPLPSLLLNVLFAVSAGMYLNLLLFYFQMSPAKDFWLNFSYCVGFVSLLYVGKLLILKAMGWIFKVSNATNTYLFIVFLVNKMMGMFLLPFLFLLAFPHPAIISGMVTLSFILLIALLFYRFIISYRPIRGEINVGRLHFIIYLCAFEIAPLLLIYKVLLIFVARSN